MAWKLNRDLYLEEGEALLLEAGIGEEGAQAAEKFVEEYANEPITINDVDGKEVTVEDLTIYELGGADSDNPGEEVDGYVVIGYLVEDDTAVDDESEE